MTKIKQKFIFRNKRLYYDKVVNDQIPETYDQFKAEFIDFCTGDTLTNLRKYKDEKWSDYIKRTVEWAEKRSIVKCEVIRHLRIFKMPMEMHLITFLDNIGYDDLIDRAVELEKMVSLCRTHPKYHKRVNIYSNNHKSDGSDFRRVYVNSVEEKEVKCYICGKIDISCIFVQTRA